MSYGNSLILYIHLSGTVGCENPFAYMQMSEGSKDLVWMQYTDVHFPFGINTCV